MSLNRLSQNWGPVQITSERLMTSEELRRRRDSLESFIDWLNWGMVGFTVIVAIGLVIEWNQPTFRLLGLHDFGGLLVTGGVSGEVLMAFIAQIKGRTLRIVNANIESDDNTRLKAADERIAELNLKAEQEQLARVKIEEKLAGWRIEQPGLTRLLEKLKPYAGTPFNIKVHPQSFSFMKSIDGVLLAAGWVRKLPQNKMRSLILVDEKASVSLLSGIIVEKSASAIEFDQWQ
jgi:hypothetical protein